MTREEILKKMKDNLSKLEKGKITAFNQSTMLNYLKTLLKEIENNDLPEIVNTSKQILND